VKTVQPFKLTTTGKSQLVLASLIKVYCRKIGNCCYRCVYIRCPQEAHSKRNIISIDTVEYIKHCPHPLQIRIQQSPSYTLRSPPILTPSFKQHMPASHFINANVIASHVNSNAIPYISAKIMKCYTSWQFITMKRWLMKRLRQ
jgi:hypothetical protein